MEKEYEIAQCPFCGSKTARLKKAIFYGIICYGCGAHTIFFDKEYSKADTVDAWNRRCDNGQQKTQ